MREPHDLADWLLGVPERPFDLPAARSGVRRSWTFCPATDGEISWRSEEITGGPEPTPAPAPRFGAYRPLTIEEHRKAGTLKCD